MGKFIKRTLLPLLVQVIMFATLAACNNSVEEVSRTQPIVEPPTPGVSVTLNQELQTAMTLGGQLSLQLSIDDTATPAMLLDGPTARIDLSAQQMQGEHRYYIAMHYTAKGADKALLVAEAEKLSRSTQVQFTAEELQSEPYDKDKSGTIEMAEQQILDEDTDTQSNLSEILAGGNPQNPEPSFLSADNIQVREKLSLSGQLYSVYMTLALSPRQNSTLSYSIVGGTDQNRFSIDPSSGVLSFVDDTNVATGNGLSWPSYIPNGNNDYSVDIKADDGSLSKILTVTVSVTNVFNLSVTLGIKTLQFTWFAEPQATYYKLLQNPDGNNGFSEMPGADRIVGLNFDYKIAVDGYDALKARYLLQAYGANGLINTSEELNITSSLLAAVGYIKAPDSQANSNFGGDFGVVPGAASVVSLSANGNILAVGASGTGTVYLYNRGLGDSGMWDKEDFTTFVKAPTASGGGSFGSSVSLSANGATLAVGASREVSNGITTGISGSPPIVDCNANICQPDSGAVYIFERDPSGIWNQGNFVAFVKAPNAGLRHRFGNTISISADGSTLAVGVAVEDSATPAGISINPQASDCKITPPATPTNCLIESGAAYVYERGPGGKWAQGQFVAFIKAPNARAYNLFGTSVSLSADGALLAVGAPKDDSPANGVNASAPIANSCSTQLPVNTCQYDSGAAYLFERDPTTGKWAQGQLAAFIKAPNVDKGDWFGTSVSLSADGATLAVGAYWEGNAAIATGISAQITDCRTAQPVNCVGSGAVYLFEQGQSGKWDQGQFSAFVKSPNAVNLDAFGISVSLSADGGTLAVGANRESSAAIVSSINGSTVVSDCNATPSLNCLSNSGAVYVFRRASGGIWGQGQMTSYFKATNAGVNTGFGSTLSLSADASTLVVGGSRENSASSGIGGDQSNDCDAPIPKKCALNSGAVYLY